MFYAFGAHLLLIAETNPTSPVSDSSASACKRSNATQMLLTAVDQNVVANDRAGNVGSWRYSGRNHAKSGH